MKTMRLMAVFALALAQLACGGAGAPESLAVSHGATVVPPEWNCATTTFYLGRSFGESSYLITDPLSQIYSPIDAGGDSITLSSSDGIVWFWSSTALIRAIFIRADVPGTVLGDATNQVWMYVPPQPGGAYRGGVYTEDNTNQRYPAKQIEFCFDAPPPQFALQITKTAQMSYDKTYEWSIEKRASVAELTMMPGQTAFATFFVDASVSAITAGNFAAAGQILVHNPAPIAATITGITDSMPDATPTLDCGVTFPFELAAGADLTCDWSAALPDGSDRANVVFVTTEGAVEGGQTTAFAGGATATVTEIDECATFTDDHAGILGTVCAGEAPRSFEYAIYVGPYEACGSYELTNVASFVTNDTEATGSSSVTIPITVVCAPGCTLTPGYWKTHSKYGPAPFDDTWELKGEDTPFFLSGLTWYSQFLVEPSTSPYFQLSHQYAAAVLNLLNGADTSAVNGVLKSAGDLLAAYTPAQVAAGSKSLRARFVSLAATLDAFNNGVTGPGHCDW